MLASTLREAGYEVREAANGQEAMSRLAEGPFSAVLLDLNMARPDGNEILAAMPRENRRTPVIVITGFTDLLDQAHQDRVSLVIAKPFRLNPLLSAVQGAIAGGVADTKDTGGERRPP